MGEMRNAYKILLVGKTERRRCFRRPENRLEDNIRMDLRKNGEKVGNRCIWLRIGTNGASWEHGNKLQVT